MTVCSCLSCRDEKTDAIYFQCLGGIKMILVYPLSEAPSVIRKRIALDSDTFIKARDFYHHNKDMRHHKIVVYKDGDALFCLGWIKNNPVNLDKDNPRVQMHLSNFWDYSLEDDRIDYSYIDRYQLFIFDKLEEYSYHCAKLIMHHNQDDKIIFTDTNAAFFFETSDKLMITENEEELFERDPSLKQLRTLRGMAEIKWDVQGVFMNTVSTIEIMTSLYWLDREFSYGPKNPDKTFYLIKQPVKENGLTAIINNIVGIRQMVHQKRPDFIPVVDLSIANDPNQFAGTSGADVWDMFFKQLSDVSLEEVYDSQHVILDQNSNLNMNPYMTEFTFTNQRAELTYGDDMQYKDEVVKHTNEVLDKIFPQEKKRILAVVVRGSDYLSPKCAKYVPHGISGEETLQKAIAYVKEKHFDYVYLATEDEAYLKLFRNSELKDKLIFVDQQRIDYTSEDHKEKLLIEIFTEERSNPYTRTLDYIAVLEGLTRCDALLANVPCGAVTYAFGRGTAYEFADVSKIDIRQK